MNLAAIKSAASNTEIRVFCLLGAEELLADRAEETLRSSLLTPGTEVFNLAVFRGDDERVDESLGVARTMPMMSRTRIVVIRRVEELKPAFLEKLFAYAEKPVDTCVMILRGRQWPRASGGKDFGRRIEALSKKQGGVFRFGGKTSNPVDFVVQEAQTHGCTVGPRDAKYLVSRVGKDLGLLQLELRKAIDWLGEPGRLTQQVFAEACSLLSEEAIWNLTDAIVEKNTDKALASTHRLLEGGVPPHVLSVSIANQLRNLLALQSVLRRNENPKDANLGIKEWKLRAAETALRRSPLRTTYVLETLAAANEKMNSSRAGDRRVLEGLVLKLTSQR